MSKMKLNQAFYTALDRVEVAKSRILALHYAFYPLRSAGRFSGEPKKEFSALHALLYERSSSAVTRSGIRCNALLELMRLNPRGHHAN